MDSKQAPAKEKTDILTERGKLVEGAEEALLDTVLTEWRRTGWCTMANEGMDADSSPRCRTEEEDRRWDQPQDDDEIHKLWTRASLDLLPNSQVRAIFIDEFSKFLAIETLQTISLPGV